MKKRLFSLAFALLMVLSSTQAFAVKREHGAGMGGGSTETRNLLDFFGSFDKEEDVNYMGTLKAEVSWVANDSATGVGGCLQVSVKDTWGHSYVTVPNVIGETYDISFYAKTSKDKEQELQFIPMTPAGGWDGGIIAGGKYTTEWKKYTCSYVCDGKFSSGGPSSSINLFNTRHGSGRDADTYFLDELSVVPRGDVKYDWSTYRPVDYKNKTDIIPADDGFATPQPIGDADFKDTKNHWAESNINILTSSGYVQGMGDGTFAPEKNVTRAEFVTMAMNLFDIERSSYKDIYTDVSADHWFAKTVQTAYDINLVDKMLTVGKKFKPDEAITREEAATIIAKLAKIKKDEPDGTAGSFSDEGAIVDWAKDSVDAATAYGVINGYPDGTFAPKKNITRAEASAMLFRVIELGGRLTIYVDGENGNDKNDGTQQRPLKTIEAAKNFVKPYLKNMNSHLYVFIKGGTYRIEEPITFTPEDSGTNGYSVIYTSWGNESPVISGGQEYGGFELYDSAKNIYRTYIGEGTVVREAYVNGVRGTRARTDRDYTDEDHILTNGYRNYDECWYSSDDLEYVDFKNKEDMEFIFFEGWTNPRVPIKDVVLDEDGKARFLMEEEAWKLRSVGGNTGWSFPVAIENAYELLDAKGEWYLDRKDGYFYYKPRDYEDPATMTVTLPFEELGFIVAGDSVDEKVHNLKFDDLSFKYFTWLWPETSGVGYQDSQGNLITLYPGDGRITGVKEDAPLIVLDAAYIDITNCAFTKLGGEGVTFRGTFQHINFIGNHVYDISGTGVSVGIQEEDVDDFTNDVQPTAYKYYKIFNKFNNNLVHDVGIEYAAGPGFNVSFPKQTEMNHNEVYNTGYGGYHIGYGHGGYITGIKGFSVSHNYIHDVMNQETYDCGAVYTVCSTSGTHDDYNQISYNYIENIRKPYGALYPDEGSTFWEIHHNVIENREVDLWWRKMSSMDPRWLHIHRTSIQNNYVHDNYSTFGNMHNASVQFNKVENAQVYEEGNWPNEAQSIVENSGLQGKYLEQYPNSVQRLRLGIKDKRLFIQLGEQVNLDLKGYGRKLEELPLDPEYLNFYSSNEEVVSVDENGVATGIGSGKATLYAEYLDGDVVRRQSIDVVSDDKVTDVDVNVTAINMMLDTSTRIVATGRTQYGNTREITDTVFVVDDPSIVKVTANGSVTSLKTGKTVIHATFKVDDKVLKLDIPVRIVTYVQEDTLKLVENSRKLADGDGLFAPGAWSSGGTKMENGGVALTGAPNYYTTKMDDSLMSFDMSITATNGGWPSLILKSQDSMQDYGGTDLYFIGIKEKEIEFQRFNSGERTMIFGDSSYNPVGGPGIVNILEGETRLFSYDETYSVTVGTLKDDLGTRIIFAINGKPIFDYLDVSAGYISGNGYFGIQEGKGQVIISPYTGKTYPKVAATTE